MRNRPATATAAIVVIAASALAFGLATHGLEPSIDSRLQQEIGRALARETLKLVGAGGHVTVLMRDTTSFRQPAADAVLAGFQNEVRRGGIAPPSVQRLQIDPLRPVQVPSGDFIELLRRAAPSDVIVSLMGPPLLTDEQRAAVGGVRPKIVAFCPGEIAERLDLRRLHEVQLLHAAVLGRSWHGKAGTPSLPRPAAFDDLYVRAGATELAQRPEPSILP